MANEILGFTPAQYERLKVMLLAFESGTLWPSEKNRKPQTLRELARVPFLNDSGETIPAWGVMRITDAAADSNGNWRVKCGKPNTTFYNCYLVNGARDVAATGGTSPSNGSGSFLWHSGQVLCDNTYAPARGEEWGPTSGSWKLVRNRPGFLIDGGPTGTTDVYRAVAKQRIVCDLIGKPSGDMTKGTPSQVTIHMPKASETAPFSSTDYEDAGYSDIYALPIGSDVTDALFCSLRFEASGWLACCLDDGS